jgi:hypothetical protein
LRIGAIVVRATRGTYNRPQLVENGEFEPKLDAVKSALKGDLNIVEVGILGTEESDIHQNDQNVDINQVSHDSPKAFLLKGLSWFEYLLCCVDVKTRDDKLLYAKSGDLNLFHD